jgi:hypothetical protein
MVLLRCCGRGITSMAVVATTPIRECRSEASITLTKFERHEDLFMLLSQALCCVDCPAFELRRRRQKLEYPDTCNAYNA